MAFTDTQENLIRIGVITWANVFYQGKVVIML